MNILLLFCLFLIFSQPNLSSLIVHSPTPNVQQDTQDDDAPKDMTCGQILVRGSKQLTEVELCRFLDHAANTPHDLEMRKVAQARIIAEYQKRGFFDIRVTWDDETQKPDAPIVRLLIKEGKVYVVRRVEIVGNTKDSDLIIRRKIVLNEDTPYDEDLLELSIKRINQLGIFEEFTRENVKIEINKKGHFVDFTFTLKEKE